MSTSSTIPTMKGMMTHILKLEHALEGPYDLTVAEKTANDLYKSGQSLAFQEVIGNTAQESPLPIAWRLVQLLSKPDIQHFDDLKSSLSKANRIFLELVMYKSFCQDRKVYYSTKDEFITKTTEVLKALPKKAVAIRHDLKCTREAAKALSTETHYLSSRVTKLVKAAITFSPIDLILIMTEIGQEIALSEHIKSRYMIGWQMNWSAPTITTIAEMNQFQTEFSITKDFLKKSSSALYLAEINMKILKNRQATSELKHYVFEKSAFSLLTLVTLRKKTFRRDNYWKTRYLVMTYLGDLSQTPDYLPDDLKKAIPEQSIKHIVYRMCHPNEKEPVINLGKTFYKNATSHKDLWKDTLIIETKKRDAPKLDSEIQEITDQIKQREKTVENRKQKINTEKSQAKAKQKTIKEQKKKGDDKNESAEFNKHQKELESIEKNIKELQEQNKAEQLEVKKDQLVLEELQASIDAYQEVLKLLDTTPKSS